MPEQHDVKIIQWPKNKAKLEHSFEDERMPVSIVFDDAPANVKVSASAEDPVHMNMDMRMAMNVMAREAFPVCIKICEPICADSNYAVDIKLLGQPLFQIGVKGRTKLGQCDEAPPPGRERCVDFSKYSEKDTIQSPFESQGITYATATASGTLRFVRYAPPPTPIQLGFPNSGLRIKFPVAVSDVKLKLVNFGNSVMEVKALDGGNVVYETTTTVEDSGEIILPAARLTEILLRGGSNEAALVELCFRLRSDKIPNREPKNTVVIR